MVDQQGIGSEDSVGLASGAIALPPAPMMKRLMGLCADLGILTIISQIVAIFYFPPVAVIAYVYLRGSTVLESDWAQNVGIVLFTAVAIFVYIMFVLILFHGYFIRFESRTGTSPGKKLFGLRVISLEGGELRYGQVVLRDILRWYVDFFFFPAVIAINASPRKQRVGDLAAKTMVVHSAADEDTSQFLYLNQADYLRLREILAPGPVPPEVCRKFLEFAFPEYGTRMQKSTDEVLELCLDSAKAYIARAVGSGLEREMILRFFAEFCSRSLNRDLRGRKEFEAADGMTQEMASPLGVSAQAAIATRPAGFWIRLCAWVVDLAITSVITCPLSIALSILPYFLPRHPVYGVVCVLTQLFIGFVIVPYFYHGWFYVNKGASPGKLLFGLKILDVETGVHCSYWRAWCREVPAKFLSVLILYIGFLMAGVRRDRRALHDLLCQTQVIRRK